MSAGPSRRAADDTSTRTTADTGRTSAAGIDVLTIETSSLGDRSYPVTDGAVAVVAVAVVVDPQRDTDRVTDLAAERGVRITHVLQAHTHDDHVTGGHALAREVGADHRLNAEDEVSFERTPVRDGDGIRAGDLVVRAMATPGHTLTHLSYAVTAAGDDSGAQTVVLTGGSLLHGSTGRPDLMGAEHGEDLVGQLAAPATVSGPC